MQVLLYVFAERLGAPEGTGTAVHYAFVRPLPRVLGDVAAQPAVRHARGVVDAASFPEAHGVGAFLLRRVGERFHVCVHVCDQLFRVGEKGVRFFLLAPDPLTLEGSKRLSAGHVEGLCTHWVPNTTLAIRRTPLPSFKEFPKTLFFKSP